MEQSYEKVAKKIVDIFADGRINYNDWKFISLFVVTQGREDYLLNRIEHFATSMIEYRRQIEFGWSEYEQDVLF